MVIIAENETMKCSFMIKGEEMAGTGLWVGDISFHMVWRTMGR